jgi:hypothetical protein
MMKRPIAGIVVCAAIFAAPAAAQMPKYGVTVTVDKKIDFAALKTYSWTAGQPSADKAINARVIAAVDRELSALGMTPAASGPGDVLVTYNSLSRTDVDVMGKADEKGNYRQYWVGTLVVALLDPASRGRQLRLRIYKPIDIDRAKLDVSIDAAVAALFVKYPTRTRK